MINSVICDSLFPSYFLSLLVGGFLGSVTASYFLGPFYWVWHNRTLTMRISCWSMEVTNDSRTSDLIELRKETLRDPWRNTNEGPVQNLTSTLPSTPHEKQFWHNVLTLNSKKKESETLIWSENHPALTNPNTFVSVKVTTTTPMIASSLRMRYKGL